MTSKSDRKVRCRRLCQLNRKCKWRIDCIDRIHCAFISDKRLLNAHNEGDEQTDQLAFAANMATMLFIMLIAYTTHIPRRRLPN